MRQSPAPPPPPAAPTPQVVTVAPATGEVQFVNPQLTAQQVAELRAARTELSNQLNSAEGRRERLAEALQGTDGAARDGLEARIRVLDERIVQLESDIAETGRQLTGSPTGLVSSTEAASMMGGLEPGQVTAISMVFTIFVLFPLAIAAARLLWKRAAAPRPSPAVAEGAQRLERVEQAVDTIAIEIERISEGQRFVTRLLTEARGGALGLGEPAAEPVGVLKAESARAPRGGA